MNIETKRSEVNFLNSSLIGVISGILGICLGASFSFLIANYQIQSEYNKIQAKEAVESHVKYLRGLVVHHNMNDQVKELLEGKLLLALHSDSEVVDKIASLEKKIDKNDCKFDPSNFNERKKFRAEDELLSAILKMRKNILEGYGYSNKEDDEDRLIENFRILLFCGISKKFGTIDNNSEDKYETEGNYIRDTQ